MVMKEAFKTFPNGFPLDLIDQIKKISKRGIIGNRVASGTQIIEELGELHKKSGDLILYTSADPVLQIAAHEDIAPLEELYRICQSVRDITKEGSSILGRIIARPFVDNKDNGPKFMRTKNRRDFALTPPHNLLNDLERDFCVIAVGKIADIFANSGISEKIKTYGNQDGFKKTLDLLKRDFNGLCFINYIDFDELFGHRRDRAGYERAILEFDNFLGDFLPQIREDDLLLITADHGNDPTFKGSDHTREDVPLLCFSPSFQNKEGGYLHEFSEFSDVSRIIYTNFYEPKRFLDLFK